MDFPELGVPGVDVDVIDTYDDRHCRGSLNG